MKYLMIDTGLCVQPTVSVPTNWGHFKKGYPLDKAHQAACNDFKKYIESLPKLPTTCTIPAGEWFEGRETNEVFSPDTSNWTEEDWKEAQAEAQRELPQSPRKVIVPVEQKDEPKAGDSWLNYIKQFPKLDEFWNAMPEPTKCWLSQQIDIFAGQYQSKTH